MTEQEICTGIAARIWCDQDMETVTMDVDAAEEIAQILERSRAKE